MTNWLRKKSWVLVVVAFLLLIGAWSTIIVVSQKNRVEMIEISHD